MPRLVARMFGASALNRRTYEEVEADQEATPQALVVVLLAGLAAGVGWIGPGADNLPAIGTLTVIAVIGWVAWAVLTYLIGTHFLPGPETRADPGELLRTLAFAGSPGVLFVLGAVPGAGSVVTPLVAVWTLADKLKAGLQQLMAGARKFSVEEISRDDIVSGNRETERETGEWQQEIGKLRTELDELKKRYSKLQQRLERIEAK